MAFLDHRDTAYPILYGCSVKPGVEELERREAPVDAIGKVAAFGGLFDPLAARLGDAAFGDFAPVKPLRPTLELDGGQPDEPTPSEEISLADLVSDYSSHHTTRRDNTSAYRNETAERKDPNESSWALTWNGEWDDGLTAPFAQSAAPTLSLSFASESAPPPPAAISLPANFSPRISAPVAPTAAARHSSNITDLSLAVAPSSFGLGAHISAYTAITFPDGRIMDDGLPPGSGPAFGDGSDGMVISQVYAAGGQTGSQYRQDYVELFNRGDAPINLSNWSVQYADAESGSWQVIPLTGTVLPGQYYLVWGATGTEGLGDAPTPDATGAAVNLVADAGKVALVSTTTALIGAVPFDPSIVDFVGYGAADAAEGSGAAPASDLTVAALRDNGGLNDTDDNTYDFTAGTPTPRNTASPLANRPPVNTVPDAQTTPQDTALTFSVLNGNAFTIADPDAAGAAVEVSLSGVDGTLTLAGTIGLSFTVGDGSADAEMTFSGAISAINTALDGMSFTPTAGFVGPAVVGIVTDDQGNTGAGGAQYDIDAVLVSVGGPLVAINDAFSTWEDTATDFDVLANDASVHGQLYLEIVTGPSNGDAWVNDNGTLETFDDFLTYQPTAEFHGADSLTYAVSDDYSNYATATVALTVVSINDARIVTPSDQGAEEGEFVEFFIQTPDDTEGSLTFGATGLPSGLEIDQYTGQINGVLPYDAAQVNDGVYNVMVTATAGGSGDQDSQNFVWYVNDINRITLIDDQVSRAGESVYFQIDTMEGDTYTASGLPSGLEIDQYTGVISGIVAEPATPGITQYTTTVTVSGNGVTDERMFVWNVLSGNDPIVLFAINDTLRHQDDITLLEPTPLPLTVRVILYAPGTVGAQSVSLSVPSGRSSLDTSVLLLEDGQSDTVTMTPQQVSAADDDVVLLTFVGGQQRGEGKAVNMKKIVIKTGTNIGKVRASTTPEGMADRIPPRVQTPYTVIFEGPQVQKSMHVAVYGDSADNGDLGLIHPGADGLWWARTVKPADYVGGVYNAYLQGTKQTKPGHAGELWVGVFRDGEYENPAKVLTGTKTAGFSVAAIPVSVTMKFDKTVQALGSLRTIDGKQVRVTEWGAVYRPEIVSDSGEFDDLNEVRVSEVSIPQPGATGTVKGMFQAGKVLAGKYEDLSDPKIEEKLIDYHTYAQKGRRRAAVDAILKLVINEQRDEQGNFFTGKGDVLQYVKFIDKRTDPEKEFVVLKSGFKIHFEIESPNPQLKRYSVIHVKKTPQQIDNVDVDPGNMAAGDQVDKKVEMR